MSKYFFVTLSILIITFETASNTFSASSRIITTEGIDTWLVAAVPGTGDAVANGNKNDWIKLNLGINEADYSIPKNGPKIGEKIDPASAPKFAWKGVRAAGGDNVIDFQRADIFGENDNIAAYMYLYINSDMDRKADIWVGSDDTIKVWLNGKEIHNNPALRGWAPNQDIIKNVEFKKGQNGLLIKVCEQGGGWAGWCRIDPVDGLKISVEKDKEGKPLPAPKIANYYITQFLSLIGPNPQADAAIAACNEDLIKRWTNGKFTEESIANGIGIDKKFPLTEKNASGWELTEFTDFSGDNIQILVRDFFGRAVDQNNITWYGYTTIICPDRRNINLKAGSDDAIKIWLNGKIVHNNPVLRGTSGFQDTIKVTLEKGVNSLLVKICEQGGGWAAFVGFDEEIAYKGLEIDATRIGGIFSVNPSSKSLITWGKIKS